MKEFPGGSMIWAFGNEAKFCLNLVLKVKILQVRHSCDVLLQQL